MSEEHTHKWIAALHLDGCHFYSNHYKCECGAGRVVGGEREFWHRGKLTMSIMWELDDCERCVALLARARRKPGYDITVLPDGTEIRNKRKR